jgi:hypothetical protein
VKRTYFYFYSCSILLLVLLFSCVSTQKTQIQAPLKQLMRLTGLGESNNVNDVVTLTQAHWLRPKGSERFDLSTNLIKLKPEIKNPLEALGLIDEVTVSQTNFDYLLLLGAAYQSFDSRVKFLESAVHKGLRFKKLVLLGSLRPLDENAERALMKGQGFLDPLPTNEIEMMELLLARSSLSSLKDLQIVRVASSMKKLADGTIVRANTRDTIVDFAKSGQSPGNCLAISNQPYVLRQDLVIRGVLKEPWQILTVGPKAQEDLPEATFLDELARYLYESREYLKSIGKYRG